MKTLLYSTRPFLGREGKNIVPHISILKNDLVDILSNGKTDRIKKEASKIVGFNIQSSISTISNYYTTNINNFKDWEDFYTKIDVSIFKNYDRLFILGGMDLWRSNLTRFGKRAGVFPKDSGQINWISTGLKCANILSILKAHNEFNIPLHELSFDPNEISCNLFNKDYFVEDGYFLYHGYDIPRYNIIRLDSLQKFYNDKIDLFSKDKIFEFTFGYTVLKNSNRKKYIEDVDLISKMFQNYNIFIRNDFNEINTLINQDEYVEKLKQSKFTFMLPSYDETCFSIYRFIDAIYSDCLPIIHKDCNIKEVEKSYDINLNQIVYNENIDFFNKNRVDLIDYYKRKCLFGNFHGLKE